MGLTVLLLVIGLAVGAVNSEDQPSLVVEQVIAIDVIDNGLANTELILAFVICRHGDRTPHMDELDKYPAEEKILSPDIFFPFGTQALTNQGKQRGYLVGHFLRKHYDGFISSLYLPDESTTRTTAYPRTQMTALTALSALFPPPPAQRWNPVLDWQPVPYDTLPCDEDDLLYYANCPRYMELVRKVYELPEVQKWIEPYRPLFRYLTEKTKIKVNKTEDVFFLDNLFQTLENVGVPPPKWAQDIMHEIKEVTKIEYALQFYNPELISLATGVMLTDIVNASSAAIRGDTEQPKLRMYSAHENNVAALMAAARVFKPHQPEYGATFALELRKLRNTDQYGFVAVYSPKAGGPAKVIPIEGCGGGLICDFDTFLHLTQDYVLTKEEYKKQCSKTE